MRPFLASFQTEKYFAIQNSQIQFISLHLNFTKFKIRTIQFSLSSRRKLKGDEIWRARKVYSKIGNIYF